MNGRGRERIVSTVLLLRPLELSRNSRQELLGDGMCCTVDVVSAAVQQAPGIEGTMNQMQLPMQLRSCAPSRSRASSSCALRFCRTPPDKGIKVATPSSSVGLGPLI